MAQGRVPTYDHLFKILLLGDSDVGKHILLHRFVAEDLAGPFISTINIDFRVKTVDVDGKRLKLQIWDTAGQERFSTITSSFTFDPNMANFELPASEAFAKNHGDDGATAKLQTVSIRYANELTVMQHYTETTRFKVLTCHLDLVKKMENRYYRGARGLILLYDVRNRKSFLSIEKWLKNISDHKGEKDVSVILVGNYNEDSERKEVSTEEAQAFAEQNGLQLFEISSVDAAQIKKPFLALARQLLEQTEKQPAVNVTLDEDSRDTKCFL